MTALVLAAPDNGRQGRRHRYPERRRHHDELGVEQVGETFRGEVDNVFDAKPRVPWRLSPRCRPSKSPCPRPAPARADKVALPTDPPIAGASAVMPGLNPTRVSVICAV